MITNNEEARKWFLERGTQAKAVQVQNHEGAIKLVSDYPEAIAFMSSNVKSNLTNQFKIVLGDSSCDGHNISETIIIFASTSADVIETAFKNMSRKMGFLIEYSHTTYASFTLCQDYEQSYLTKGEVQTLANYGIQVESSFEPFELEDEDEKDNDDYGIGLNAESYQHLLMRIAQQELDFVYVIADENDIPALNIGAGYGLYTH